MRNLTATLCLTIAVHLGNAGESFALPPCSTTASYWHNCFGTLTSANGDKYVGEYRDDKRHGQGTSTYAKGDKYVGEFRDDKKHGQGIYSFANGDKYVGEFRDNKRHGQGTYTYGPSSEWAGDKYVGEYRNNKRHGQGAYTSADGRMWEGVWESGKFKTAKWPTVKPTPKPASPKVPDESEVLAASSGSGFALGASRVLHAKANPKRKFSVHKSS
jgi:hypothetical protein